MVDAVNKSFSRSASVVMAACIGLASAMMPSPGAAAPPEKAELKAKVMRFIDGKAGNTGDTSEAPSEITIDYADLNGDGAPEAVVIIKGFLYCGSRGCAAYVLDLGGPEARSIGEFIAVQIEPLASNTGGWRDIAINGRPISFRDGAYRSR